MKRSISLNLFLCFTIGMILCSCKEEEINLAVQCEGLELDFGPYTLSESSRMLFPYTDKVQRLIFTDAMNAEYEFDLDTTGKSLRSIFYLNECPYDPLQEITFRLHQETCYALFTNEELEILLQLQFVALSYLDDTTLIGETDVLYLNVLDKDFNPSPVLRFQLKHKHGTNFWSPIDAQDSVLINHHLFSDVYFQPIGELPQQEWIGYFNFEEGIVGLEHVSGSPVLSLERIE